MLFIIQVAALSCAETQIPEVPGERGRNYHPHDKPEAGAVAVVIKGAHHTWTLSNWVS